MEELIGILFAREIIRFVGKYSRYFFFKIIGKDISIEKLSNVSTKEDDFAEAVNQDMLNAIVGMIVFIPLCVVIAFCVFS